MNERLLPRAPLWKVKNHPKTKQLQVKNQKPKEFHKEHNVRNRTKTTTNPKNQKWTQKFLKKIINHLQHTKTTKIHTRIPEPINPKAKIKGNKKPKSAQQSTSTTPWHKKPIQIQKILNKKFARKKPKTSSATSKNSSPIRGDLERKTRKQNFRLNYSVKSGD